MTASVVWLHSTRMIFDAWAAKTKRAQLLQNAPSAVHGWAFEGDLPESFECKSNLFEMEWPPRSGKRKRFPEVDQARFFSEEEARRKLKPAQLPFLDRLRAALG